MTRIDLRTVLDGVWVSGGAAARALLSILIFLAFFGAAPPGQFQAVGQVVTGADPPPAEAPLPASAEPQQNAFGTVKGRIFDQTGNGLAGVDVRLLGAEDSVIEEVRSDEDGQFVFPHVQPGPLRLILVAEGFATQTIAGALGPAENLLFPRVVLLLATQITEIRVTPSIEEIAQEQLKDQERQRVLGIIPNFYVSYVPAAAPLTSRQKFQLALKATTDPVSIASVTIIAGINQAADRYSGFGQGFEGYAKRYAASYANFTSSLFIGGAILPSLFQQDPRYFYRGTGTKRSRFLYAISRTVICKGDNQRWQPNYSSVLGDLAAGGISNLYIPERDRHGAALTFENAAIGLATSATVNVLQEFVLHRLTSKRRQVLTVQPFGGR